MESIEENWAGLITLLGISVQLRQSEKELSSVLDFWQKQELFFSSYQTAITKYFSGIFNTP